MEIKVKDRIANPPHPRAASAGEHEPEHEREEDTGPPAAVGTAILALTRDAAARDLLMEIAMERGFGLCPAADSAEAIRLLETQPPALVVIDIDISEGRKLLGMLRAQDRWNSIPLFALTGTNNPMVTVTIDAPVFFKPELEGLQEAVVGRFESAEADLSRDLSSLAMWPRRTPSA